MRCKINIFRYKLLKFNYSSIFYYWISCRTGVIKVSSYARLDRDKADSYSIIVNAIDSGMPSETSTVTIKVKVLDTNNKAPKYVFKFHLFSILTIMQNNFFLIPFHFISIDLGKLLTLLTCRSVIKD